MAIIVNTFVDLDSYLVDIFAAKDIFFSLINAYNRAQSIITCQFPFFCGRPQICYHFIYPITGTAITLRKMYTVDTLIALGVLACEQTMEELYRQAQTLFNEGNYNQQADYVAAMIIKAETTLHQLFDIINKTAIFMGNSKNFCFNFTNPFITCVNVEPRSRTYGTGLMNSIINRSACVAFNDIFYFEVCSNATTTQTETETAPTETEDGVI